MTTGKKYIPENIDCIESKDRSVINYWCEKLSVSPFTLFHVIKTVGNNINMVEEFLHSRTLEVHNEPEEFSAS